MYFLNIKNVFYYLKVTDLALEIMNFKFFFNSKFDNIMIIIMGLKLIKCQKFSYPVFGVMYSICQINKLTQVMTLHRDMLINLIAKFGLYN